MNDNPPLATPILKSSLQYCISAREIVNRAKKRAQNVPTLSKIKIVDFKGDITKEWYVEFYTIIDGKKERHRIKGGLNRIKNKNERYAVAAAMVEELKLATTHALYEVVKYHQPSEDVKIKSEPAVKHLWEILEKKKGLVRDISITAYATAIKHFTNHFGNKGLHDIDENGADEFIRYLRLLKNSRGEHYAPKTIHSIVGNLRNLFNSSTIVDRNPFAEKKLSSKTTGEMNIPWSNDEFSKLREFTEDKLNLQVYWGMIYFCAIRPTEMSYLKKSNINLCEGTIRINSIHSKVKQTHMVSIPKLFKHALEQYISPLSAKHYLFSHQLQPGLSHLRGNRLSTYWKVLVKDKTGLEKNIYQLKHTAAIKLLKSGISIYDISKHFRHSEVSMTEQYLKHLQGHASSIMIEHFPDF